MKNRKNNTKSIIIVSAIGAAAVAVSITAAYNSLSRTLVPTSASSYSRTFSAKETSEVPAQNSVSGVPLDSDSTVKTETESETSAEPVNKPVKAQPGNIMPVEGDVDVPFSNGELVKSVTLGVWKTHDGADILCEKGTDVKSMSDGTVKEIKDDPLWGVCVTIEQSNGLEVRYCGLAKELSVKAGQELKQGEIIGKTGDTNQCEVLQKPHLHLEVKDGSKYVDPLSVVGN